MEVLEKIPFKDKPQCGYLIKKSKRGYELFVYNLVSEAWMDGFSNLDDCHLWIETLEKKEQFKVERFKWALYVTEPEDELHKQT